MLKNLSALLFSVFFSHCFALTGYQIELVIFSHLNRQDFASEQWPLLTTAPTLPDDALELNALTDNQDIYPTQPNLLTNEVKKLKINPNYKVILHTAWIESLEQLNKKTSIRLTTEESKMEGTVTVSLQRYFDLNFNLAFNLPSETLAKLTDDEKYWQLPNLFITLKQDRRTRSQELNYVDHPLFGVLFKITPVT